MSPDDFDDDEPVTVTVRGDGKLTPEHKFPIRKMIREAIRYQNAQVLFTCRECCFYQPRVIGGIDLDEDEDEGIVEIEGCPEACTLESTNRLVLGKRMPTQLSECFSFDPLTSAFASVLDIMHGLGIDFYNAKQGWATVVGRIAQRADKFGYISGVTQRNLDKYGS